MNLWSIIIFGALIKVVIGTHFRGATFSWYSANGSVVSLRYLSAWQYNSGCSSTYVSSGNTVNSQVYFRCSVTCNATSTITRCTDSYSGGNWFIGEGNSTIIPATSRFNATFNGGNRINGADWNLQTSVDLSVRSDTGRINSSPWVEMPLILYWQSGCTYNFQIPVQDDDGDVIKCRWATGSECLGACNGLYGSTLYQDSCTLSYYTSSTGYYLVSVQIEDYANTTSTQPFSSIPLQFLLYVFGSGCTSADPTFVSPTPTDETAYEAQCGRNFSFVIRAKATYNISRIAVLTNESDGNLRVTEESTQNNPWYYMTTTVMWVVPNITQQLRVCFYARGSNWLTSTTRCVFLKSSDADDCTADPCKNDGNCTDLIADYTCACAPGFTDKNCSTNIDECISSPCENGGTCRDLVDDYTCDCVPGFTNKNCSNDIDDCIPNPCQNGGLCRDLTAGYICYCVRGFTDKNCSTDIDECIADPCKNGGSCRDSIADYSCDCVRGFTDKNCSTDIDDCTPNPCVNRGTCRDLVDDYTCDCVPGFIGKTCFTNKDDCLPNPCVNGGICIDRINSYTCSCSRGFADKNCSTNINDCAPNPCRNGGVCIDEVNDFTCSCAPGFTDKRCSTNINECFPEPCENNGTCSDLVNDYRCSCLDGFTDKSCSTNIDDCSPTPCINGGNCNDLLNDYTCTCMDGFTDKNCSTRQEQGLNSYSAKVVGGAVPSAFIGGTLLGVISVIVFQLIRKKYLPRKGKNMEENYQPTVTFHTDQPTYVNLQMLGIDNFLNLAEGNEVSPDFDYLADYENMPSLVKADRTDGLPPEFDDLAVYENMPAGEYCHLANVKDKRQKKKNVQAATNKTYSGF